MDREDYYIKLLLKGFRPTVFGIGDDSAVINTGAKMLSVTTDNTIERVHFTSDCPLKIVIHKAIKRSLTDTLAVGARPVYLLMNTIFPDNFARSGLKRAAGLVKLFTREYNLKLIGGDTSFHRGPLVISTTIMGTLIGKYPIARSGAGIGDYIYLTGALGRPRMKNSVLRVDVKRIVGLISSRPITAMIDITDGFAKDLARITVEWGNGALVRMSDVPVYGGRSFAGAARAGEDYEFLFTSPQYIVNQSGIANIGRVISGKKIMVKNKNNQIMPLESDGWSYR